MLRFAVLAAGVAAGGYLLTAGYLLLSLDSLVFYPSDSMDAGPADFGLEAEDVAFTSVDGVPLHGWYFPRRESEAVIVFCHGNAGNISHRLFMARQLLRAPADLFLFDYRGYGSSGGKAKGEQPLGDASAAVEAVRRRAGNSGKPIILMGESLGGAVALTVAPGEDVDGVIAMAAFTSVRGVARDMPFYRLFSPLVPDRFNALAALAGLEAPVLVIHGTRDEIIPFSHGEALYAAARGRKEKLWVEGGMHNDLFERAGIDIVHAVTAFIESLPAKT